jgi:hypothetical protein
MVEVLQPERQFDGVSEDFEINTWLDISHNVGAYDSEAQDCYNAYLRTTMISESSEPGWVQISNVDFIDMMASGWHPTYPVSWCGGDGMAWTKYWNIFAMSCTNPTNKSAWDTPVKLSLRLTWTFLDRYVQSINPEFVQTSTAEDNSSELLYFEGNKNAIVGIVGTPSQDIYSPYRTWNRAMQYSDGYDNVREVAEHFIKEVDGEAFTNTFTDTELRMSTTVPETRLPLTTTEWIKLATAVKLGYITLDQMVSHAAVRKLRETRAPGRSRPKYQKVRFHTPIA